MSVRSRDEADRSIAWVLPFWAAFICVMGLEATATISWLAGLLVLLLVAAGIGLARRLMGAHPPG